MNSENINLNIVNSICNFQQKRMSRINLLANTNENDYHLIVILYLKNLRGIYASMAKLINRR